MLTLGPVTELVTMKRPPPCFFMCGSPAAAEVCQEFYEQLVSQQGLNKRARVLAHSHGGLISYGPNNFELFKQAGGVAGKILRGAKPSEFPIQRPTHLSFLINLSTARLLQLAVPASLSALADEVIE